MRMIERAGPQNSEVPRGSGGTSLVDHTLVDQALVFTSPCTPLGKKPPFFTDFVFR